MNKKFIATMLIFGSMIGNNIYATSKVEANEKFEYINEYFEKLNREDIKSSDNVEWVQFAPGNAGDSDGTFIHPTDDNIMFSFPDMGNGYRSGDGGLTWETVFDHDQTTPPGSIRTYGMDFSRQDPNFGMASNWQGIKMTTDGGKSFSENIHNGNIEALVVDPTNDEIWFAGSGNFWDTKNNYRTDVKPHGKSPAWNAGQLFKTTDKGKTWTKLNNTGIHSKAEFGEIYIYPDDTNLMFTTTTYGLYKSIDAGNTWTKIETIEKSDGEDEDLVMDLEIYRDPETGKLTLYIINQVQYHLDPIKKCYASTGGILKSHDLGETWENISGNIGINITALQEENYNLVRNVLEPNNIEYRGSDGFPRIWLNVGMNKYFANSPVIEGTSAWNLAQTTPTQIMHNYDQIKVDPTNPDKIYVSHDGKWSASFLIGDVFTTDDGGKNWYVATRSGMSWEYPSEYWDSRNQPMGKNVQPDHYNYEFGIDLYANQGMRDLDINSKGETFALYRSLYKTVDGGEYWQNMDSVQLPNGAWSGTGASNLPGKQIIVDERDPNLMYMVAGENRLFKKVDGFEEYYYSDKEAMINLEHSPENISMIAIHPHDINTMYSLMLRQGGQGELYRSSDAGQTWKSISTIFVTPDIYVKVIQKGLIIDPINPDNMYFAVTATNVNEVPPLHGTQFNGVYKSTDGGYNWTVSTTGLPGTADVFDLEFGPEINTNDYKTIYAASSAGNPITIDKPEGSDMWSMGEGTRFATSPANYWCAILTGEDATMHREITGLKPNMDYYISGFTSVDEGNMLKISVETLDGELLGEEIVSETMALAKGVAFKTKPDDTSIILRIEKIGGEENGYFDRISLKTMGGLYKSENAGDSFSRVESFPDIPQVNMVTASSDKIYVAGGNETTGIENGGLWVGNAEGKEWRKIFDQAIVVTVKVDPFNENRIMIITKDDSAGPKTYSAGVYLSTDEGANWERINKGIGNAIEVYDVEFDLGDPNILWLTSSAGGFYKGFIGGAPERPEQLEVYDVTYFVDEDTSHTKEVQQYSKARPLTNEELGIEENEHIFETWYLDGELYNFNTPVIKDITLTFEEIE
ncbi:hypothetical protein AN643_03930 [Candidatus Epulonipiscioides saccharophilum]|nr:hypothetical protein AN643_03930 [Epulopiscium sp. SCG-B10WGA-EpuloB]